MTRAQRLRNLTGGALVAAFLAGAAVAVVDVKFTQLITPLMAGAFVVLVGLGSLGIAWRIWGQIDEVVREAHKSAWYWGGSVGLCLAAGVMVYALRLSGGPLFDAAQGLLLDSAFAQGVAVCLLLQLIGYGLGWAGWWLSKR